MNTNKSNTRFCRFASALRHATGDKAELLANGKVLVLKNEFTPERSYRSVQDAVDHFAYLFKEEVRL